MAKRKGKPKTHIIKTPFAEIEVPKGGRSQ
jgi:hypothetical protein